MNKVITKYLLAGNDNETIIQCEMEDGTTWKCDIEGNNWKKVIPSENELTIKFNEANRK